MARVMDEDPDQVKRVTIELEGRAALVDAVVTLLRYVEMCGEHGTTRWVELMVDGDGAGQLRVRTGDEASPRSAAVREFLLRDEGSAPETCGPDVYFVETSDGPRLKIDLV